ncbi:MAG: hypothetical protein AAF960_24070 [Bacteroidota bacterium]
METYQIIRTLKKLDKYTVRSLKEFMSKSPFVSDNKRQLFAALIVYRPNFNNKKLTLQAVHEAAFTGTPYCHDKIINLFSDLQHLVELFLVIQFLKKDKFYFNKLKAIQYYKDENYKAFHKEIAETLRSINKRDDIFIRFERQSLFTLLHYFPHAEQTDLALPYLSRTNEHLDELYVINKLRYFCELKASKKIIDSENETSFSPVVLEMAQQLQANNQLIQLYLNLYKLDLTTTERHFLALKDLFVKQLNHIPYYEGATLLLLLQNHCIQKYLARRSNYLTHQLELYKIGLKNNFFSPKGYISHSTYLNIVITALAKGKLRFVEDFRETYQKELLTEVRSDCQKLCTGYLNFELKNFANSKNAISNISSKTFFIDVRKCFLELKCHFEFYLQNPISANEKQLLTACKDFDAYIEQKTLLSNYQKDTYQNFLNLIKIIYQSYQTIVKRLAADDAQTIEKVIHQTKTLAGWEYLLSKVRLLSKIKE